MKPVQTPQAPAAIGPYSQAIDCGSFLVTSGQVPFDPATGEFVPGGITEQTRQVLTNIKAILEAAGLTMDNVVKTTVFLQSMGDFAAMNAVYAEFFTEGQYPARSAVAAHRARSPGLTPRRPGASAPTHPDASGAGAAGDLPHNGASFSLMLGRCCPCGKPAATTPRP